MSIDSAMSLAHLIREKAGGLNEAGRETKMIKETYWVDNADGIRLRVNRWHRAGAEVKAVVQILHGMGEHIDRYDGIAEHLVKLGFEVYGHDHRGHGMTAGTIDRLGFFAEKGGWRRVVEDAFDVTSHIKERHSKKRLFMIGHSMGSFMARNYVIQFSELIDGLVLTGTGFSDAAESNGALMITKVMKKFGGAKKRVNMMDMFSLGGFNKRVPNPKTKMDWLTRDPFEVQRFIRDPYCGGAGTLSFYDDIFKLVKRASSKKLADRIRKDLPIALFSGKEDPVGKYGVGVEKTFRLYDSVGIEEVRIKLYEGARHEIVNEINRETVYKDIAAFLLEKC